MCAPAATLPRMNDLPPLPHLATGRYRHYKGGEYEVLGIVRSPDAPVFGIDVSAQKARTAMFFSAPFAAADLNAADPGRGPGDPGRPPGPALGGE